ncbi:LA2681 family HEPN domain-containing protein [Halorussus limi]|uniref:LA2681 family HEPN domain-containing protein n=1 Tax=Halorussus limi TaxID=2938695 RepID=A0A8U0HWY1_9EURY|nr:LA2681 family HEPN domain-containing protein [Halorussus limi]UPV75625.1 LA2681 family HEPN domain-containing protein [Halorussus limi]
MPDVPDNLQDLSEHIHVNRGIENPDAAYTTLVNADDADWAELHDETRLHLTGVLYNLSEDLQRQDGLDRIIELHTETFPDTDALSPAHEAIRHYQLANAYSLRHTVTGDDTQHTFFESTDLLNAIGHARASVSDEYDTDVTPTQQLQRYTNFAGYLARTGRVCEALHWHHKAVEINPEHGMALGKRAITKQYYASLVPSQSYAARILHSAYTDYEAALQNADDVYPQAKTRFRAGMESIEQFADDQLTIETEDEYELGDGKFDVKYHEWVLNNRLYLNPLNDISMHSFVAHDPVTLPGMIMPDGEEFPYPGVFNQIKQEFVSARYMYYEGWMRSVGHSSDRNVTLQDTLDYSVYGYRTEQIKSAFRTAYSVFDKIAVIINEYYDLGHDDPSFRSVWHNRGHYSKGLEEQFVDSDNWALNALFWLRKDFHEDSGQNDDESPVVVAHELRDLRNAIEHDYLKVYRDGIVSEPPDRSWLQDTQYYPVGEKELREVTVEMLRLARAALLYTTFALAEEERMKREEIDGTVLPMGGNATIPDDEKR